MLRVDIETLVKQKQVQTSVVRKGIPRSNIGKLRLYSSIGLLQIAKKYAIYALHYMSYDMSPKS